MLKKYKSVDEYISSFPDEVAIRLQQIRDAIKQVAKTATEKISYNIPAFALNGNLVYYGGFENHVSFFPHSEAIEIFSVELKNFKTSKGTIQFPHDKKLPINLIKKIVRYRVEERMNAKLKKTIVKKKV